MPDGAATFQVAALNQAIDGLVALQLEDTLHLFDRVEHICQRAIRTIEVHYLSFLHG